MNFIFYDIETTKNCFLVVLQYNDMQVVYKISKYRNDYKQMVKHWKSLIQRNFCFVGYNNIAFDAQIIEFILQKERTAEEIYAESQRVIEIPTETKFLQLIPEWKLSFKNIDIFKIKGFDSRAKATSLKFLEFNLRMASIEEMPLPHDIEYTEEQEKDLEEYCKYDVFATIHCFNELDIESEVNVRMTTGENFNVNILNAAEPRMAKTIFLKELSRVLGKSKDELKQDKEKYLSSFTTFNVNIPEYIKYEGKELNIMLDYFRNLKINRYNTKNVIDKEIRNGNVTAYLGSGGLHSSVKPQIIIPDENEEIIDIDWVSFYPFLKIRNGFYPKYLTEKYLEVYYNFYLERKKHKKGTPLNYAMKILLNSSFGLMNEENSPIYDPIAFMNVTITGQLTLLMFTEMILKRCPKTFIISQNTDGILLKIKKEDKENILELCKEIVEITKIDTEIEYYKKVIVQDVNNYISINVNGSIKRKGIFEVRDDIYKTGLWNKNTSFNIIPLALQAYFVEKKDIRQFIKSHTNIYDFLGAVKKKSDFELYYYDKQGNKHDCQKITRYYLSNQGYYLVKDYGHKKDAKTDKMKHVTTKVEANNGCKVLNKVTDENALNYKDLDYNYYISETEKIIFEIEGNFRQTELF